MTKFRRRTTPRRWAAFMARHYIRRNNELLNQDDRAKALHKMKLKVMAKVEEFMAMCLTEGMDMSNAIADQGKIVEGHVVSNNCDTTTFVNTQNATFVGADQREYLATTTNFSSTSISRIQ